MCHFSYIYTFFFKVEDDENNLVPHASMTDDCIVQTWYRFLNTGKGIIKKIVEYGLP